MMLNLVSSWFILTMMFLQTCDVRSEMSRYELMKYLLHNTSYDPEVNNKPETHVLYLECPGKRKNESVEVDVQVEIFEIFKAEDKYTEFTMGLYLRLWWTDPRLNFTSLSNSSNINRLEFAEEIADKFWQPDVYFLGSVKLETVTSNKLLYVYRNGSVVRSERMTVLLISSFNLTYYPYDEQKCLFELQSFTYTNDSLVLRWRNNTDPVKISAAEMSEFKISTGNYSSVDTTLLDQVGNYSTLKSVIVLTRTGNAHFYQLYGPSFAIVFVSWLALFLDERRISPRITIHTGCIIASMTQYVGIYLMTPTVGYFRAIDVWMITHLMILVTAFLANILSLIARRDDKKSPNESETVSSPDNGNDSPSNSEGQPCENVLFSNFNNLTKFLKSKLRCCAGNCILRVFCSCDLELGGEKSDSLLANRQGKLIEYVAVISLFIFYVSFITSYAVLIPSQKTEILTFFNYVTVAGLIGSICFVSLIFICIGNKDCGNRCSTSTTSAAYRISIGQTNKGTDTRQMGRAISDNVASRPTTPIASDPLLDDETIPKS